VLNKRYEYEKQYLRYEYEKQYLHKSLTFRIFLGHFIWNKTSVVGDLGSLNDI